MKWMHTKSPRVKVIHWQQAGNSTTAYLHGCYSPIAPDNDYSWGDARIGTTGLGCIKVRTDTFAGPPASEGQLETVGRFPDLLPHHKAQKSRTYPDAHVDRLFVAWLRQNNTTQVVPSRREGCNTCDPVSSQTTWARHSI